MAKIELTGVCKIYRKRKLHQIRNSETGEIGGWVENLNNIRGDSWIDKTSIVMDAAVVDDSILENTIAQDFANFENCNITSSRQDSKIVVKDSAELSNTLICDFKTSKVEGCAKIICCEFYGNVKISGNVFAENSILRVEKTEASGSVRIEDSDVICDLLKMTDRSFILDSVISVDKNRHGDSKIYVSENSGFLQSRNVTFCGKAEIRQSSCIRGDNVNINHSFLLCGNSDIFANVNFEGNCKNQYWFENVILQDLSSSEGIDGIEAFELDDYLITAAKKGKYVTLRKTCLSDPVVLRSVADLDKEKIGSKIVYKIVSCFLG